MWVNEVIAAIVGLSGGMVVATALADFYHRAGYHSPVCGCYPYGP